MKNINIPFLLILVISFFTAACNKEEGSITSKTKRLIDKESSTNGFFFNYTYDANGQCVRIDAKDSYTTYVYGNSTVTETIVPNSSSRSVYTYSLNAQGLATKKTYISGSVIFEDLYEYDTKGFILKFIFQYRLTNSTNPPEIGITKLYERDTEGDLISIKSTSSTINLANDSYTYAIDKKNYETVDNEYRGLKWRGKLSLHAISSETYKSYLGAITVRNRVNIYDAQGYILQTNYSIANGASTYTYTYK